MADFTPNELKMFQKWVNVPKLHTKQEFWDDVLKYYHEEVMTLPIPYNPYSARRLLDSFECEQCGHCCTYDQTPIETADLKRIAKNTEHEMEYLVSLFKNNIYAKMYLPTSGGCMFLDKETKKCTIYDARPSTCMFFPLQGPNEILLGDGAIFLQAQIKLSCKPAVMLAQEIINEALAHEPSDGSKLLPDLSIVQVTE